jgi:DNA-binding NarL/FixJ family response regulator
VVAGVCQGLTNREIASRLGKSEFTVKNQVSVILRKVGLPTRARLIAQLR